VPGQCRRYGELHSDSAIAFDRRRLKPATWVFFLLGQVLTLPAHWNDRVGLRRPRRFIS
jgi:hypothetical protein